MDGGKAVSDLFEDELLPADLVGRITAAYREKLLLNPPTPSFNARTNPEKAEKFAGFVAPKDITRLLAVLAELGLEIVAKTGGVAAGPGHGDS